jgi:uncharacterized repeat protein (TIGR03847 family)
MDELGAVEKITADAVGEPGTRTFYLQAAAGDRTVTVIVEKQQVQLLAASILELLSGLDVETGLGPDEETMVLDEPFDAEWRAGRLSIGYEEDSDLFVLEVEELIPELEDEDDPRSILSDEPRSVRLRATREQMLALSRHGAAVAERGRPLCQFCGNPMSPEGHTCPAMNGHSKA